MVVCVCARVECMWCVWSARGGVGVVHVQKSGRALGLSSFLLLKQVSYCS